MSTSATLPSTDPPSAERTAPSKVGAWSEVLAVFLRLGLTSFGGPIAHLAYFREEFVVRRQWLDEDAYADLVSLCQFLPGPASSQVGIALGYRRARLPGALSAWVGFTLPSALLMMIFALGLVRLGAAQADWLIGLKVFAVAIVAHAVWGMARVLCPDGGRRVIAISVAGVLLVVPWPQAQLGAMVLAGIVGWLLLPSLQSPSRAELQPSVPRRLAIASLSVFVLLLVGLPAAAQALRSDLLELFSAFYRTGALVFGGGHVVLPLLQVQLVPPGWIDNDTFLAGYAAAQVVPGPLFTYAAFLGAAIPLPGGVTGATIALLGIFTPGFLLVIGALPFWHGALQRPALRSAVAGVNAGVVGVLLAALITPVATSALGSVADGMLALVALTALTSGRVPVWTVALACAGAGALLH
ncbi:MAG: chromate efflux transporter [Burkholderiaceae bacterium]